MGRDTKSCAWCKLDKPLGDFGRRAGSPDGHQSVCKRCLAENWRKNHNIKDERPIRRRSPYDNMATVLCDIERVAEGNEAVLAIIENARGTYCLATDPQA